MDRRQIKQALVRNIEAIFNDNANDEKSNTMVMFRVFNECFETLCMVSQQEKHMNGSALELIKQEIAAVLDGVLETCERIRFLEHWPDVFGDYRTNHGGDWDSGIDPPDLPITELEGKTRYRITRLSGEESFHRKNDEGLWMTTRRDNLTLPATPPHGCYSSEFVKQVQKYRHQLDHQPSHWTRSKSNIDGNGKSENKEDEGRDNQQTHRVNP